ncbi:hypothetical protein Droror1_Dr00017462 [Drosera rotundifolia]
MVWIVNVFMRNKLGRSDFVVLVKLVAASRKNLAFGIWLSEVIEIRYTDACFNSYNEVGNVSFLWTSETCSISCLFSAIFFVEVRTEEWKCCPCIYSVLL